MDPKKLRGLYEAYSEVYAPIEELYKGKHGQTETEYQDSRSNAGKMVSGDSKGSGASYSSRGVENTGPNPAGGSQKPKGQGRMTSGQRTEMQYRKANLLKKEEAEIDEAVKGASRHDTEMRKSAAAERRAGIKPLPAKEGEKYAKYKMAQIDYAKRKKMEEEVEQVDEAITSEKGKAKAAEMIAKRSTASGRAKPGQGASVAAIKHISRANVENLGGTPATPTIAKNPVKSRSYGGTGNKAARRAGLTPTREKPNAWKEELDIFDVVLEFLQAEGYAETLEEAEWMMANVINDEAINIIVGEGYQRNPEKGEEEDKKYAPVRGEKRPMPPRGHKDREAFEKWYAANVR